jgi:hypothetical protein
MADEDQYSEQEAKRRFEAALRGARLATPQPMKEIPSKRAKAASARKTRARQQKRTHTSD